MIPIIATGICQSYHVFWKDADPGLPEVEDARKGLAGINVGGGLTELGE